MKYVVVSGCDWLHSVLWCFVLPRLVKRAYLCYAAIKSHIMEGLLADKKRRIKDNLSKEKENKSSTANSTQSTAASTTIVSSAARTAETNGGINVPQDLLSASADVSVFIPLFLTNVHAACHRITYR